MHTQRSLIGLLGLADRGQVDVYKRQMSDMMMAQNGYEANLATVSQAEQAYQAALGMHI